MEQMNCWDSCGSHSLMEGIYSGMDCIHTRNLIHCHLVLPCHSPRQFKLQSFDTLCPPEETASPPASPVASSCSISHLHLSIQTPTGEWEHSSSVVYLKLTLASSFHWVGSGLCACYVSGRTTVADQDNGLRFWRSSQAPLSLSLSFSPPTPTSPVGL